VTDERRWTVDEVASLPEDLHYELINERLVLTPAQLPIHQALCQSAAIALRAHRPQGVLTTTHQSVMIDSYNEPRPDVVVMRVGGANRTPVLAADVLLVAEVLSPSSMASDREEKAELYAYAGFASYWIIGLLAERITFTQFLLGSDGAFRQQVQADEVVTIDQPWQVTLDLPAWTRCRDELRATGGSY
jgi:Uma2 family endonuclease